MIPITLWLSLTAKGVRGLEIKAEQTRGVETNGASRDGRVFLNQ